MSETKLTEPNVENLRKAVSAVYLACEKIVADDISNLLKWSADQIESLTAERDRTARNRDMWKGQCERQAEQLAACHRPEGK